MPKIIITNCSWLAYFKDNYSKELYTKNLVQGKPVQRLGIGNNAITCSIQVKPLINSEAYDSKLVRRQNIYASLNLYCAHAN